MRETEPVECSEMYSAPSAPATIASGVAFSRGISNTSVNSPAVVMRATVVLL